MDPSLLLRGLLIVSLHTTIAQMALPERGSSIFDEIERPGMSFEDQVITLEEIIGGTVCGPQGFPSESSESRGKLNIHPCYCDEICAVLHNCCPDILIRNLTSHDGGQGSECVETVATGLNISALEDTDLRAMITTCPSSTKIQQGSVGFQNVTEDTIAKCENYDQTDPVQALPVSSTSTKVTYRNTYCAQCNNVDITGTNNLLKWDPLITCKEGIEKLLYGSPDKAEIYRILNSKEEASKTGCRLKYVTQNSLDFNKECKHVKTPLVESCNQTGEWRFYDEKLDRACNMYTSILFNTYKNVFCWLCNLEHQWSLKIVVETIEQKSGDSVNPARMSFQALLDFSDSYTTEQDEDFAATSCKKHQIYNNVSCQCQDLKCSEGKGLSPKDDSVCESVVTSNYMGHRICFQIDLVFRQPVNDIDYIVGFISFNLKSCCFDAFLLQTTAKSWCPGDKNVSLNAEILDYAQHEFISMDEYDRRAMHIVRSSTVFTIAWLPRGVESHAVSLKTNCPNDNRTTKTCVSDRAVTVSGMRLVGEITGPYDNIKDTVHFIDFTMINLCPHVDLPANEFEIVNDTLYHIATRFEVESHQVDVVDNMTLRVCRDAFLGILSSVDTSKCADKSSHSAEDFDTWTIEGLVSIICTSLSLVCLFLTFLTYLIFPKLRDASGKNIMTLTLLLFLSQAFFEFAIEQFENETACTCFGILIHYFWLAAVFSMNACTVERFYKLCFPLRSRAFFYSRKPFIVASVYSLVSPLIIVGINILVNYEVTGHIGYGNSQICYIRELNSRIFAFALPLAVLLLTNLILFAITIYTIRRQTVPGHKTSSARIGIKACVQLSFVTGLTWLLAFLYDSISISELGYVFTALIGLQGVMFFYSIVLNKRVIALYRGLFESKSQNSRNDGIISRSSKDTGEQSRMRKISFANMTFQSDLTKTSSAESDVAM